MNNYIDNSYMTKKYGRRFWQCRMCVKRYTTKYNVVTHMLTHSKTGKFIDSNFKSHKIQEKTEGVVNRALFFSSSKISEVLQENNACSTSEHLPIEQNCSSPEASSTNPDLCAHGTVDGIIIPEYVPRHNAIVTLSQLYGAAMNNYIENSYITKKYGRKFWQCRICVKRYTNKDNFVTHMLTHFKTGKLIDSNFKSHKIQEKTKVIVNRALFFSSSKISEVFQKKNACSTSEHLPMEQNYSSPEASSTKPDLCAHGTVDGTVVPEYVPRHNGIMKYSQLYRAAMNNYIDNSYVTKKYGRKLWQCRKCVKRYTTKYNFVTHMLIHSKTGKCIGSNIFSHELQQKTEGGVKSAMLFNSNKISEVIQENNACSTSEHLPMEQNCSSTEVYSTKPDLCARGTVDGAVVPEYVPRHNEIMTFSQLYREVMNNYIDNSYMTKKYGRRFWQCRMCVKRYTTKYNVVTHMLTHSKTGKFIDSNFKSHKIQEKTEGVVNRALFFSSSKISEVLQENNACSTSEHLPIEQNCSSPEASSTNPDLCAHGTVDGIIIPEYVPRHNAIVTFSQLYRAAMNNYIDNSYITKKYGRKLWQCRICVKRYTTKYNFVTHMLTHSETGKLIDSNFKSHKI
ncbi:zinc finger protein 710-like [Lethenteron reissneri]|uniref:zinc finger protein 710-like n=1 Tax=Lethenteron reissneri TaxID=7753 RepID=UPI002AB72177|nr:zinc finger protein 710-like [Lethenteron reissneri]